MITRFILLCCCALLLRQAHGQPSITGSWQGAIEIMGAKLNIVLDFRASRDSLQGTIDIPQQGAKDVALKNVKAVASVVHFELPAGPGLATFDGTVRSDTMSGLFSQAGIQGTFAVKRTAAKKTEVPAAEPLPYAEEEVQFRNGDVTLAGTLTLPKSSGRHPAVVLISGSGPQNRDEEILGFRPFRILADHLTRNGVAVLRYDDRGVGGSTGNSSQPTTADFADDAEAAVKFLKSRSAIDPNRIGLCGHSEGGIVAAMLAARSSDIAFIILLAGTSVPGDKVISWQAEHLSRAAGVSEKEIQKNLALQNKMYAAVRTGIGWEKLREEITKKGFEDVKKLPESQRKQIPDERKFVETQVDQQLKAAQTLWFRYFIDFDPAPTLAKVKCPVLALFGELDTQVAVELNKTPMENVLKKSGNKNADIRVLPGVNHLFQSAKTGLPSEYGSLKKEFAPEFLNIVSKWTLQRASKK